MLSCKTRFERMKKFFAYRGLASFVIGEFCLRTSKEKMRIPKL